MDLLPLCFVFSDNAIILEIASNDVFKNICKFIY